MANGTFKLKLKLTYYKPQAIVTFRIIKTYILGGSFHFYDTIHKTVKRKDEKISKRKEETKKKKQRAKVKEKKWWNKSLIKEKSNIA